MTKMRETGPRLPSASTAEPPTGTSGTGRLRVSAALVTMLLVLVPGTASAQTYPPAAGDLTISTSVAGPGDVVTVSGDGFLPGTTVTITFESAPVRLGTVQADADGRFTTDVRVPLDASPGVHTIKATGLGADGGPRVLSARITIVRETPADARSAGPASPRSPSVGPAPAGAPSAGPAPARRGGVAFTGANLALATGLALALLGGGVVVLGVAGRRAGQDGAPEPASGTGAEGEPE